MTDCKEALDEIKKRNAYTFRFKNSLLEAEVDRALLLAMLETAEERGAALREASTIAASALAAAISLLERGGNAAKKAAPSDKMFDQMLADYRGALSATRKVLKETSP